MPHCKNWMRVSSDKDIPEVPLVRLVVTGSHNLSKAAWGCEEKGGTQVHIRSYEEWVSSVQTHVKFLSKYPVFL